MSDAPAMHFGGGVRVEGSRRVTEWAAGWPCCCSGRRAMLIPRERVTTDADKVTCETCRSTMRKDVRAAERFPVLTVTA